jgi:hypothetical protein
MILPVMGAARYWDDPEADLEETIDLPLPASVRVRPDPPPVALRIFKEVVDAIRLVGGVLVVGGLGVIVFNLGKSGRDFAHVAIPITSLAVIPGALYLVAAEGLAQRRRYWAWVMSLLVTIILMLAILGAGYYFIAVVVPRNAGPGGTANMEALVFPIVLYFSMPSLIMVYMLRALPVIREAELLTYTGFHVLPPVPVQTLDPSEDRAHRRRLEDEYERSAPGPAATSRGQTPPAPSRRPPPRRS